MGNGLVEKLFAVRKKRLYLGHSEEGYRAGGFTGKFEGGLGRVYRTVDSLRGFEPHPIKVGAGQARVTGWVHGGSGHGCHTILG